MISFTIKRRGKNNSLLGSISHFWIPPLFSYFLQLSDEEATSRGKMKFLIEGSKGLTVNSYNKTSEK